MMKAALKYGATSKIQNRERGIFKIKNIFGQLRFLSIISIFNLSLKSFSKIQNASSADVERASSSLGLEQSKLPKRLFKNQYVLNFLTIDVVTHLLLKIIYVYIRFSLKKNKNITVLIVNSI